MNLETKHILSKDGTPIGYRQYGSGDGLILVHGGLRRGDVFDKLATALAHHFTVYTYDRRGRESSPDISGDYSLQKECEDLMALLKKTNARYVFGHSFGGLITLETAIHFDVEKIAVYEPAVSVNNSFPTDWIPDFKTALKRNKKALAVATFFNSLEPDDIAKMPKWLLVTMFRIMPYFNKEIKKNIDAAPTLEREIDALLKLDANVVRYSQITCPTLLLSGLKSPAFLKNVIPELHQAISHSEVICFEGLGHGSPEESPQVLVNSLIQFFK